MPVLDGSRNGSIEGLTSHRRYPRDRIHSADISWRHCGARQAAGMIDVLPKEAFEDLGRVLQILTTHRDPR